MRRAITLFSESVSMTINALWNNKLRSFLSILGITIGIFCIIVVYALVHSLEKNLNDSFDQYGTDVVFVQKWPWDDAGFEYPWWRYISRPSVTFEEAEFLEAYLPGNKAEKVAMVFTSNGMVESGKFRVENTELKFITAHYPDIQPVNIEAGRFFTETELSAGREVAIIGATVASTLFENKDPIGKKLRIKQRTIQVIGVLKKEGNSIIGNSSDETVIMPAKFGRNLFNYKDDNKGAQIMVKAAEGVTLDDLTWEVNALMKRNRRLGPSQEENFAVNRMSMITNFLSTLFSKIGLYSSVIGVFALLVGCFGVANIMFVSVKERTQQIGIQKALGATHGYILTQYLIEAVLLCLLGGVLGLLMVYSVLQIFNWVLHHQMDSEVTLYLANRDIFIGIFVSAVIGLLAGIWPARQAAKLNPVEAIRSKI